MSQNRNLTQQLTHTLGVSIVNGKYPVGEGMPSEAILCKQFEVSRSSTREAVKMLSAKGLISSRPKKGIRVLPETEWNLFDSDVLSWILQSKPSLSLLREFTQVRAAIEPNAMKLAARNATPKQLKQIEEALFRIAEAEEGLDDQLDAHICFLNAILQASGNRFFIQFTQFVKAALKVSIRYNNQTLGVKNTDVSFHADVFDAIKSGDEKRAYQLVEDILADALALIESRI
ncbi:FadR family transcriptional regulator [Paraglaciecola arctica]|nr:FadR/GntR family transcriptional regulator [Paraglaciecola arctica]MBU3002296.1 FadR family transcriptional regulator [Paraglaciecola arctica]